MEALLATADAAIAHHAGWIAFGFALLAFAESVAFVGVVLPATPFLLLMGSVLGEGRLSPWAVIPGAMLGAAAGYGCSYLAGKRMRGRLSKTRWLRRRRRSMARVRAFLSCYGPHALILGRYALGPLHSLMPFVAGVSGMPSRRFWLPNLASAVAWVPITLAPGYIAARAAGGALQAGWQMHASAALALLSVAAAGFCLLMMLINWGLSAIRR